MPGHAQTPLGDVYSSDATVKGAVVLSAASTRLMSGSSVKAGLSNASVRLLRGGEVRVCQGSSVSLTASSDGAQIMVGMSSGTIEMHYPLANSRDSIMTPDFEIALAGSGVFHLAVSTDQGGNTCVQSLHGNTGTATVSELMGDGSYTVKPGGQAFFRAGHATNPGAVVGNCGCPAPVLVERAAAYPPMPVAAPAAAPLPPVAALIESSPRSANVTAPPPAEQPGSIHVQVEAPFVFRASEPPPAPNAPVQLAEIRLSALPVPSSVYVPPAPQDVAQAAAREPAKPKKKRHGLWGFLASIFKG
ncbi:MAG TPA: hypothetical protein VMT05_02975 [Terriglobales bacterium]|jgi:hypothetical protein|nr:hypothetical protein [Terriglobales bacterium]